jgi:hypothetical protein
MLGIPRQTNNLASNLTRIFGTRQPILSTSCHNRVRARPIHPVEYRFCAAFLAG